MPDVNGVEHVDLIESSDSDTPPRGATRILRVGGQLYQRIDGATKTLFGGASPADLWFQSEAAFAQSASGGNVPTLACAVFKHEYLLIDAYLELGALVGSATVAVSTTCPGGAVVCDSTAAANSTRSVRSIGCNAHVNPLVINLRTDKYAFSTVFRMMAVPATHQITVTDLTDNATGDVSLGTLQTKSATNWVVTVGAGAAAIDTGVAFDLLWHTGRVVADGANIKFWLCDINGNNPVLLATIAQIGAPNGSGWLQNFAYNIGTAAAATMQVHRAIVLVENPTNAQ